MSKTFAYARVSTLDQTPENQIREIKAAGFAIEPHRIVSETISAIARQFETSRQTIMHDPGGLLGPLFR